MSKHPPKSNPVNLTVEEGSPALLLEDAVQRLGREVRDHLEREPAKVLGIAAGVWLALQLTPRPWVARGITTLAHAGLVALGACKALEMLHAANLSTIRPAADQSNPS